MGSRNEIEILKNMKDKLLLTPWGLTQRNDKVDANIDIVAYIVELIYYVLNC